MPVNIASVVQFCLVWYFEQKCFLSYHIVFTEVRTRNTANPCMNGFKWTTPPRIGLLWNDSFWRISTTETNGSSSLWIVLTGSSIPFYHQRVLLVQYIWMGLHVLLLSRKCVIFKRLLVKDFKKLLNKCAAICLSKMPWFSVPSCPGLFRFPGRRSNSFHGIGAGVKGHFSVIRTLKINNMLQLRKQWYTAQSETMILLL